MTFRSPLPLILLGGALLAATPAFADSNGITVVSPKAGSKLKLGTAPTFKVRNTGEGEVWIHVCKSKKKDSDGVICPDEAIGQAKQKGGVFAFKPKKYTFPGFFMVTRGTYYWQAHRIDCSGGTSDCRLEGPIVKFRVG